MRDGLCQACQFGNHNEHIEIIEAAPPGMMGGVRCVCKGDCKGNLPKDVRKLFGAVAEAYPREKDNG
jgi:hypothetical protein